MTLVIGLKAKNGIVMACDSKASAEITSNDTVQKVFQLGKDSAVGIAGDGGLAMYFLDQIKSSLNHGTGIIDLAEQVRTKGKEKFSGIRRTSVGILRRHTSVGNIKETHPNECDNSVGVAAPVVCPGML